MINMSWQDIIKALDDVVIEGELQVDNDTEIISVYGDMDSLKKLRAWMKKLGEPQRYLMQIKEVKE